MQKEKKYQSHAGAHTGREICYILILESFSVNCYAINLKICDTEIKSSNKNNLLDKSNNNNNNKRPQQQQ